MNWNNKHCTLDKNKQSRTSPYIVKETKEQQQFKKLLKHNAFDILRQETPLQLLQQ